MSERDPLLERFVDAARARAADASDDPDRAAATRLAIREAAAARAPARRRWTFLGGALVAAALGSTAFAYHRGWRPAIFAAEEATEMVAPAVVAVAPAPAPVRAIVPPAPIAPIETPAPAPPPSPVVVPRPTRPATIARTAPPPAIVEAPVVAREPAPSEELAAYRAAHALHFHGADPAAALAAWDAYLARFPSGTFAVDARYDRALALIKLGRYVEARAALLPFASAAAGSYRQADAAKLIAAMP